MAEAVLPRPPWYPVRFSVDYAERQSRWKALFRLPLAVPLLLFAYILQGGAVVAIWVAILLRGRIPRWLFEFQVGVNRWSTRALGYLVLLTDAYPPFEGPYAIGYEVEYPQRVSRWRLVIWKLITSIPHLIVLYLLWVALGVVVMIAWLAILFTGRFPRGLHNFVAGVLRWGARVEGYAISMTDEFPPFSLAPGAGVAGRETYVICSVLGVLLSVAAAGGITAAIIFSAGPRTYDVSYSGLLAGEPSPSVNVNHAMVTLAAAGDPADDVFPFLKAQPGYHFVDIVVVFENDGKRSLTYDDTDFRLKDTERHSHSVYLLYSNGRVGPFKVPSRQGVNGEMLFEVPDGVRPTELRYSRDTIAGIGNSQSFRTVVFKFK